MEDGVQSLSQKCIGMHCTGPPSQEWPARTEVLPGRNSLEGLTSPPVTSYGLSLQGDRGQCESYQKAVLFLSCLKLVLKCIVFSQKAFPKLRLETTGEFSFSARAISAKARKYFLNYVVVFRNFFLLLCFSYVLIPWPYEYLIVSLQQQPFCLGKQNRN